MKLEFLDDLSDGGKFKDVVSEQLIRLYEFNNLQADALRKAIKQTIIEEGKELNIGEIDFIHKINCNLTLRISEANFGISRNDNSNFYCDLSIKGYENMISLIEPFCN